VIGCSSPLWIVAAVAAMAAAAGAMSVIIGLGLALAAARRFFARKGEDRPGGAA
jgi:hypothetical protein